jgi:CDP-glycerol glycerophosphotransferase (TagB/SpsB family)
LWIQCSDVVRLINIYHYLSSLQDFMNLDNPVLTQMIDYDAVSACLRVIDLFKTIKGEQLEQLLDRFDNREEFKRGQVILNQGDLVSSWQTAHW